MPAADGTMRCTAQHRFAISSRAGDQHGPRGLSIGPVVVKGHADRFLGRGNKFGPFVDKQAFQAARDGGRAIDRHHAHGQLAPQARMQAHALTKVRRLRTIHNIAHVQYIEQEEI